MINNYIASNYSNSRQPLRGKHNNYCYVAHSFLDKMREVKERSQNLATGVVLETVQKAIYYARKYHSAQKRQTGEPYYYHPIGTAMILSDYYDENNMFVCAILHDTLEDTKLSRRTLQKEFGEVILNCVELLTAKENETLEHRVSYIVNNTNNLKPPRTLRTLAVKVADRLHNLRTIGVKSIEKQRRTARETEDILLPIAKELGMHKIVEEFEMICSSIK